MSDAEEVEWNPKKENLQNEYMEKAMKFLDQATGEPNKPHGTLFASPASIGYGFESKSIQVRKIDNGYLVSYLSRTYEAVELYSASDQVGAVVQRIILDLWPPR